MIIKQMALSWLFLVKEKKHTVWPVYYNYYSIDYYEHFV